MAFDVYQSVSRDSVSSVSVSFYGRIGPLSQSANYLRIVIAVVLEKQALYLYANNSRFR